MTLRVRTVAVPRGADDRALLELLQELPADDPVAFVGGEVGLVGAGTVVRIPVGAGPDRGAEAQERLDALLADAEVEDRVGVRGTGPVAVGSLTFDPDRDGSVLTIPRILVGHGGGRTWVTTSALDAEPTAWMPGPRRPAGPPPARSRPRFAGSSLRDDRWLEVVADAVAAIDRGELEKVVLARDHHLWASTPFDVPALLDALAARFPGCRTFLVAGLLGASPEPLLHVEGTRVRSRILAGTAARGGTPDEDAALWAALRDSDKDRREHAMAVASVVTALREVGGDVTAPAAPGRLALDNVQHLASDVTADLPVRHPGLALLDRLHPTAAVGGAPAGPALARIRATEGMDRGRYAGPVGWTDARGDGEWALALRCAEVAGDRARLLAGAGVVAGSLPELELLETQLKLRAMLRVLEGLGAERAAEAARG